MAPSGKTGIKTVLCLFLAAVPAWSSPIVQIAAPVFTFERSVSFDNPLKRAVDQTPPPPPNTCPAHEQPIFITHNNEEFTVDINWMNNHGMAGYFTVRVDPLRVTAEEVGSEATARGVRISPPFQVHARRAGPPAGVHAGPNDRFVELELDSNSATTPNMANHGLDYHWGGIWPRVTMRITQESYRGRLHEFWRIQWNTLIRGAIAVFLVHTAGHPGCG
ncbi:hypothetical protein CB0940_10711 [Cercospora beticola]|uniref:Uncharacterized protein n=1 Tax=Cercospora beticola TaxID=122368 RepID=A0A2G5HT26_CERBT|nr:hypothetical protein CB0940_10711 [Cercospora beticola]PIA95686.1 hypothetical protein CB0940_10711 [Cercospora beticola]WPB07437.1 hypothetical protein RHO25_012098 [Cercospora beticola]